MQSLWDSISGIFATAPYQSSDFGPAVTGNAANAYALQEIRNSDAGGITPTPAQQRGLIDQAQQNPDLVAANTAPPIETPPILVTAGSFWGTAVGQGIQAVGAGVGAGFSSLADALTPGAGLNTNILMGLLILAALLFIVARLL